MFEKLMAEGTRANLAGRPAEAKAKFRAAMDEQVKRHGKDSPGLALPTMSLALQLSSEGQYPEAETRFAEAERLLDRTNDKPMKARLVHYRGVHLLNQKKTAEGDAVLFQAQQAYTALIPPENLTREAVPRGAQNRFDLNSGGRINTSSNFQVAATDPSLQPSLLGLIEVLRYRAIALRDLGRQEDADALTGYATRIAAGNNLARASVFARMYRTSGVTASARAQPERAQDELGRSDDAFELALPGTRPAAEAALIRAGELMRGGKSSAALSICRRAVRTLIAISEGTSPELMGPCLDAYAVGRSFGLGSGNRAEMFQAAQIAQGTVTSHQIAQASASLAESARDPKVGEALRRRDSLQREVDRIYRALDTIGGASSGRAAEEAARLQAQAGPAQAALAQAEAEVRTLSPNYAQLVQDVVPASAVFGALRADEAFVGLFLSKRDGWTFVLRNGEISIAKIEGGSEVIGPLVKKVRDGIEITAIGVPAFDIESTRQLYALTLGGVLDKIRGAKALVIAPTGALLSVPFEVLLTGPTDAAKLAEAPWLLRQATITHVPAATNFVSLRKVAGTSAATRPWFGLGDFRKVSAAQVQTSFPNQQCGQDREALIRLPLLPGATAELLGAGQILGATSSDELLAEAFTPDRILNSHLSDYKILHFAAHALLPTDLRCQTEAAIVTSPSPGAKDANGWLMTSSRLLALDLDANLVILSACNSGGGDGKGESLSGLARSFFFARARSLMVTHWEVNDVFASVLVQLTVKNMKDKPEIGVTGALRNAQLELLDKAVNGTIGAQFAHPFYWAPFAVIGEGGEGTGRGVSERGAVSSKL